MSTDFPDSIPSTLRKALRQAAVPGTSLYKAARCLDGVQNVPGTPDQGFTHTFCFPGYILEYGDILTHMPPVLSRDWTNAQFIKAAYRIDEGGIWRSKISPTSGKDNNSPVHLFQALVEPMQLLQTEYLAIVGWAHQECDRLYSAGRTLRSTRRMVPIYLQHLRVGTKGWSGTLGLSIHVGVKIKFKVKKGEEPLTEVEIEEVDKWLKDRYQGAEIMATKGFFWIEWGMNHAKAVANGTNVTN